MPERSRPGQIKHSCRYQTDDGRDCHKPGQALFHLLPSPDHQIPRCRKKNPLRLSAIKPGAIFKLYFPPGRAWYRIRFFEVQNSGIPRLSSGEDYSYTINTIVTIYPKHRFNKQYINRWSVTGTSIFTFLKSAQSSLFRNIPQVAFSISPRHKHAASALPAHLVLEKANH